MTDAEDLLLEIANSMEKPFIDPVAHVDWILAAAKDYFVKKGAEPPRYMPQSEDEAAELMDNGRNTGGGTMRR